jgi:hypothetical protein
MRLISWIHPRGSQTVSMVVGPMDERAGQVVKKWGTYSKYNSEP